MRPVLGIIVGRVKNHLAEVRAMVRGQSRGKNTSPAVAIRHQSQAKAETLAIPPIRKKNRHQRVNLPVLLENHSMVLAVATVPIKNHRVATPTEAATVSDKFSIFTVQLFLSNQF